LDFLDKLKTIDGQRVFENHNRAQKFADLFFHMNDAYYSDLKAAMMHQTTADYLKRAWEK